MKSIVIVFAALLLIMATPAIFSSLDNARTESASQSFQGITSSNSTANVTLGQGVSHDSITAVTGITSNQTLDTPTSYAYNSVSRILTINGLAESGLTRTLTVAFNIDSATLPSGMSSFYTLFYWFWIFIIMGMCGGAIYCFFIT